MTDNARFRTLTVTVHGIAPDGITQKAAITEIVFKPGHEASRQDLIEILREALYGRYGEETIESITQRRNSAELISEPEGAAV